MTAPALLSVQGLHAGYGRVEVLHDVSMVVRAGEVVVLLGPNGAGKSTTLLALAGEVAVSAGSTVLAGEDVTHLPLHTRANRGVALITEERDVFTRLTVDQNLRVAGVSDHALDLFPALRGLRRRRAGLLSGGEQQMLVVARSLARQPKLLLADELSLGLAPIITDELLTAVRAAADAGCGVVLVEQQAGRALQVADSAYVLSQGAMAHSGDAKALLSSPEVLTALYMGGSGANP